MTINRCVNCGRSRGLVFCPECLREFGKVRWFCARCRLDSVCVDHYVAKWNKQFVRDYFRSKYSKC